MVGEPTQEQRDEAEVLARAFHEAYEQLAPQLGYETRKDTRAFDPKSANGRLMIAVCRTVFIQQRDALQDKLSDALALAAEVALGVTHSTICSKETPCVRCDRDALKAENERLTSCLQESRTARDYGEESGVAPSQGEIGALKAELAEEKREHGKTLEQSESVVATLLKNCEAAEARVTQLQEQIEKQAKELKSLRTDVASEQLIAVRAEERRDEAQRKLEGLAEAQRQLNCDRDVELTNLRARVEQLREELTRAYKNGDAMVLEARERLAEVGRERDELRFKVENETSWEVPILRARVAALEAEARLTAIVTSNQRERLSKLEAQLRADEQLDAERLTRISKLEGALRAYREWTDHLNGCIVLTEPTYACDCGLDPLIDQADEALLAPESREGLEYERLSTGDWAIKDPANRESKE